MTTRLLAALVLICAPVCAPGGALAGSYSDFNAGIAAHNRGDWDETVRRTTLALAAPDLLPSFRVPAYIDRGDAHAGRKEWDLSVADYSAALALAPDDLEARLHRGAIYYTQKKFAAAIADYSTVVTLRPALTTGYEARAITYDEAGDLDSAIADYTSAIGIDPKDAGAYTLRGSAWRRKREYEKALADQDEAIDLDAKSPQIYFERAQTWQDAGEYRHAIADNVDGLALKPGDSDGRMQLALSQWAYGHFADAAATFAQIVAHKPASAYSVLWRAMSQARAGASYGTELAANAAVLDLTQWPGPIVKVYLGQMSLSDALHATASDDRATLKKRACEADFYIGEWNLQHDDKSEASFLFQSARDNCPTDFVERDAALAELGRMK